jgi:hypothetical protein
MSTIMCGDPSDFAVECGIDQRSPPYGKARLWVKNIWIGDIMRSMYLYHMANSLYHLSLRNVASMPLFYLKSSDAPTDHDQFLTTRSLSWGDGFDDFLFSIYAVDDQQMIHIIWKLLSHNHIDFADYPRTICHSQVSYVSFDKAIAEFVEAISLLR